MYQYRARLVRVVDADTVDLDLDLGFQLERRNGRYRLARIDAPEVNTEAGKAAKHVLLERLQAAASLLVVTSKADSFGRWLAEVYADGSNVNDWLVTTGHAVYRSY